MASLRDGRVLLVGASILSTVLLTSLWGLLRVACSDKVLPPVVPETRYITQETEDSLLPGTLDRLLQHPNGSIREVAINIVCDRSINDRDARDVLLQGIVVRHYEYRIKCHRALAYLVERNKDSLTRFHSLEAYRALVRSLELAMGDRLIPPLDNDHWDEYALRDPSERLPLQLIERLVAKHGVKKLIDAGFVSRYLARQPWGDNMPDRHRNFRFYTHTKANSLSTIITRLLETAMGYSALQLAGMMPCYIASNQPYRLSHVETLDNDDEDDGDGDDDGDDDDDDDGEEDDDDDDDDAHARENGHESLVDGEGNHEDAENVVPRARWQTDEEQRLRRQHREAMVLNDGTRPLRRGDIIEPEHAA
jgi:hypothetical protein